ncbi:MAG: lysophospholipid acyltransferase family protein [Pseudomonadota bacterium]|nr:lysophospholipid acyltransferase family protein [Pseudomonadota bacterium]
MSVALLTAAAVAVVGLWRHLMRRLESAHEADWGGVWLNRLDGLNRIWCRRFHRLRAEAIGLPQSGPALVVANHVSGLDPLLMIAASRRPLRFLIAQEEYERPVLHRLFAAIGCIPVRRDCNPRAAMEAARRALECGEIVALFPQGRIRVGSEPPLPLKRGVAYLARASGAPVIPLRVEGIRGEGRTIGAVFLRSRARLRHFPPLHLREGDTDRFLHRLQQTLTGQ